MTDKKKRSWIDILRGKGAPGAPQPAPSAPSGPAALDLSLLRTPPDRDWLACVDFGTAFSKICLVRRHGAGMTKAEHVRPLRIGPEVTRGSRSFFAPSTLYIVKSRIYFGARALQVSSDHNDPGRDCFQSPKQVLSEMADGALDVPPSIRQDPTQSFTRGELTVLLLAHLIWNANASSWEEGLGALPRLRFARPAWKPEQLRRGEAQLLTLFAKAFAVAGTLGKELVDREGLPVARAKAVFDLPRDDKELVRLMRDRMEVGDDEADSIQRGFVPEATAVAAAAIHPEDGKRRIFVVVDVGAGTTDFGAFVAVPGNGDGRIGELRRGQRVILRAGNFLDEQVVALLRDKAGLTEGMPSSVAPLAYLRREAARIKQDLFIRRSITVQLPNDQFVSAQLDELLARAPLQSFSSDLWERFSETFQAAVEFTRGLASTTPPIEVILTGGGSELPMVRELVSQAHREGRFPVKLIEAAPAWSGRATWKQAFAQLAVAVGGAMPAMPEQR